MTKILTLLTILLTLTGSAAFAQNYKLPGFGEGNTVSLNGNYYLGRAWLMSFRRQSPILDDALIQNYVENLVHRLAAKSQLKERRLEIIVVDNKSINAFAVPGGIIGIHSGLLVTAQSQAQFSSVLAHELAHLGQRHFSLENASRKRSSDTAMAALLRNMVMTANSSPDAAMSRRLQYNLQYEHDADTAGIYNQAAAGLDPGGAAGMLSVMQGELAGNGLPQPEYFRTHPVTQKRIADTRNQAARYPRKIYEASREFQLMRARASLNFIENDDEAIAHFRKKRAAGGKQAVPGQYGLILALTRSGYLAEARELLRPMREFAPQNTAYRIAEAVIDVKAGKFDVAIDMLQEGLALSPGNHPLTMSLANAYFDGEYYTEADKLLSKHARSHPSDAHLWKLLADVQKESENTLGMYQSQAEYFALNEALVRAIQYLNLALDVSKNQITEERIKTRIAYFETVEEALTILR